MTCASSVLQAAEVGVAHLSRLCGRYGLRLQLVDTGTSIPASYWGEPEAGLGGGNLYVRNDTPVHSVLHETAHFVCMDALRRAVLERDAGGDYAEEDAVCYLQILLAAHLPNVGGVRICADMDRWGYTFRLGSAQVWFESDAGEAAEWLRRSGIIDEAQRITWRLRDGDAAEATIAVCPMTI